MSGDDLGRGIRNGTGVIQDAKLSVADRGSDGSRFPAALHVCTYDVRGTFLDTGEVKRVRETGLVAHTHVLLTGLARRYPRLRLAVTQTGGAAPGVRRPLRVSSGQDADLYTIDTAFPEHLRTATGTPKDEGRVRHFYEETITSPANPVWMSLAQQYATVIREAGISDLLVQNVNPLVSIVKAEAAGLLNTASTTHLGLVGVVHDTTGVTRRLEYLAAHLPRSGGRVRLIAVSRAVRDVLHEAGVPDELVSTVSNGLDLRDFLGRLDEARDRATFEIVRTRNRIPRATVTVLVSARRVPWKGHRDVVRAAAVLRQRGILDDVVIVINGAGLTDTRWPRYETELASLIGELQVSDRVVLLDELSPLEVAACYHGADIAILASRDPEPFGYANIEAMLAGVPVIATAHGGPLEYIDPGVSGLLVPPHSPEAIADAISTLVAGPQLRERMGQAGRRSALRYSAEAMFESYAAAITECSATARQRGGQR